MQIDDRTLRALVDTGANYTAFDHSVVKPERGVATSARDGHARAPSQIIEQAISIAYGETEIEIPSYLAIDIPDSLDACGEKVEVILGFDFLKFFRIDIDERGLPSLTRSSPSSWATLLSRTRSYGVAVLATVDGSPANLMIDTGSDAPLELQRSWFSEFGSQDVEWRTISMETLTGIKEYEQSPVGELTIAQVSLNSLDALLVDDERLESDHLQGASGLGTVRRMFASIDLPSLSFLARENPLVGNLPKICSQ